MPFGVLVFLLRVGGKFEIQAQTLVFSGFIDWTFFANVPKRRNRDVQRMEAANVDHANQAGRHRGHGRPGRSGVQVDQADQAGCHRGHGRPGRPGAQVDLADPGRLPPREMPTRQPRCFTPTRRTPQPPRHFQCSFRGSIHARMGGTSRPLVL